MIVIVCGVSGTGKSTIGEMLADKMDLPFFDGDDFHPQANVQKMQNGNPLNDEDRKPWLEELSKQLALWNNNKGAVLACSALKESYRKILASNGVSDIKWVYLNGSKELLTERLASRKGHFFNPKLLDSQLDALELPDYGWVVDVLPTPSEIVNDIAKRLG